MHCAVIIGIFLNLVASVQPLPHSFFNEPCVSPNPSQTTNFARVADSYVRWHNKAIASADCGGKGALVYANLAH